MSSWPEQAIQQALITIPLDTLIDDAAEHVKVKGEWPAMTISPSLLSETCRLARVKKFMGHKGQPGIDFSATRNGRPSATTAMNFARGYFMEGLLVAALKRMAVPGDPDVATLPAADVWAPYKVLGCSPSLVFKGELPSRVPLSAHPDVVVDYCGEVELIQMKCPSVFKLDRVEKNGDKEFDSYVPQLCTEMYIGRRMGYDIKRTHLLMASWEGAQRGGNGDKVRMVSRTWDWEQAMDDLVDSMIDELLGDVAAAMDGSYPIPYPEEAAGKFPCSYCNFPRVSTKGLIGCTEQEAWQ